MSVTAFVIFFHFIIYFLVYSTIKSLEKKMHINLLFLTLTFIVLIIIIFMSDSLSSAMMVISILASFFVISANSSQVTKTIIEAVDWGKPIDCNTSKSPECDKFLPEEIVTPEPAPPKEPELEPQNTNLYGSEYAKHQAYNTSYTDCYTKPQPIIIDSAADRDTSVDERNCLIGQRRARDKKCMDGYVSKGADFYKYFYAQELEETEMRPWWGRADY
jgi:hypothetical protein